MKIYVVTDGKGGYVIPRYDWANGTLSQAQIYKVKGHALRRAKRAVHYNKGKSLFVHEYQMSFVRSYREEDNS